MTDPSRPHPFSNPTPLDKKGVYIFRDLELNLPRNLQLSPDQLPLNEWDPPSPYPKIGSTFRRRVYEAVGFMLSCWEELEARLTILYLRLLGMEYREEGKEALKTYETQFNVVGRLDLIIKASENYFRIVPDQDFEGELMNMISQVRLFTDRRNEIAHGCVRQNDINYVEDGLSKFMKTGYCLVPISQLEKRLGPSAQKPLNTYIASEINGYGNSVIKLRFRIENFIIRMKIIE